MRSASIALCTAALTIMSIFLGAGTYAYTTGGSFTIDFSSPKTIKPVISGLSPGDTIYIVIKVPNPHYASVTAKVRLLKVLCDENVVVEPEQEWYTAHQVQEKNDIDTAITFGLWIDRDGDAGGCNTAAGDKWIIDEKVGSHIDDIAGKPIPLGTIDPGKTITVVSSYHMDEETENWAQSDTMTFDIELTREEVPINARARVSLESRQDTGASSNLGTITLQGQAWSLPSTVSTVAGGYSASYTPAPGYVFDHWETTGSVTATSTTANPTAVNVGGTGTLRAVYKVIEVLTVASPNGGESWVRGTTHTLTWTSTGSPGANVKIELLKAGVVNRVISASTANDGSYSWVIPTTQVAGSDYSIRITSTTNAAINDSSNTNFAITTSHDNVDIHRQPRGECQD